MWGEAPQPVQLPATSVEEASFQVTSPAWHNLTALCCVSPGENLPVEPRQSTGPERQSQTALWATELWGACWQWCALETLCRTEPLAAPPLEPGVALGP